MNYLLSVENLKKLGLIHSNTDTKLLAVAIKRSQDMHIQPALGTPLYRALLDRVETNTWTQDYLDLMNDYVVSGEFHVHSARNIERAAIQTWLKQA